MVLNEILDIWFEWDDDKMNKFDLKKLYYILYIGNI